MSEADLKEKELNTGQHDDLGVSPEAAQSTVDELNGLYNSSSDKPKKKFWTPKKKAGAGITGLLVGVGFGLMTIIQGPLQIVHIAQMLQNFHFAPNSEASSSRIGRVYEYLRTTGDPSKRNLGYLGERLSTKYIDDMKDIGVELDFNDPNSGRLTRRVQAIDIDTNNPAGKDAYDRLKAQNPNLDVPDANGKVRIGFRDGGVDSARLRRNTLKVAAELPSKGKLTSAITKRLLIRRAGVDFHPLRNVRRDSGESIKDYFKRRQKEDADYYKKGSDSPRLRGEVLETNEDGSPSSTTNEEAADGNKLITDIENADIDTRNSFAKDFIRRGSGAAAVVGAFCAVDGIGQQIDVYQQANIVLPMIRVAMNIITVGSQIMVGQGFNIDEVGALVDTFYDEEEGTSIVESRAMQAVARQELTGPDSPVKPTSDNDKPAVFKFVAGIPLLTGTCGAIEGAGNFIRGIPGIGKVVQVGEEAVAASINFALSTVSGYSLDDLMSSLVAVLAGDAANTEKHGITVGHNAAIGGLLAANETEIAKGATALSPEQHTALVEEHNKYIKSEFSSRSVFARMFDTYDARSLVGRVAVSMPPLNSFSSITNSFLRLPLSIASGLNGLMAWVPSASAQSAEEYDFGVPAYGFSLDELNNENPIEISGTEIHLSNPYEIANYMEKNEGENLARLNGKYGKCFGTTINPKTGALQTTEPPTYATLRDNSDCNNGSKELLLFRFYLLDMTTVKSIACYEGVADSESACAELGFESDHAQSDTSVGLPTGDGPSLAQALIDSPNVSTTHPSQLSNIAKGLGPCPNVADGLYSISDELLRVLVALSENHSYTIASLHRGCTGSTVGSGKSSRHWRGLAVDISGSRPIDGQTMPSFSAYDETGAIQKFINAAAALLPAGCELGVANSRYKAGVEATSPECTKIFIDSKATTGATGPHVHIGVPK